MKITRYFFYTVILLHPATQLQGVIEWKGGRFFAIDRKVNRLECVMTLVIGSSDIYTSCSGRETLGKPNQIQLRDQALMQSLLKKDLSLTPVPTFPPFRGTIKSTQHNHDINLICFLITAKEKASGFIALDIPHNGMPTSQEIHLLASLGNVLGGGY